MNAAAIHEEVGKATGTFMDIMRSQPLSLALVVMNFLIVAYLFYAGAQQLEQRASAMKMIVDWSKETDKILGNCVSIETMKMVIDALERDRELYRRMLPGQSTIPAPPPSTLQPAPTVPPSSLEHLLPPGPRLQSGEDRPLTEEEMKNLMKILPPRNDPPPEQSAPP